MQDGELGWQITIACFKDKCMIKYVMCIHCVKIIKEHQCYNLWSTMQLWKADCLDGQNKSLV